MFAVSHDPLPDRGSSPGLFPDGDNKDEEIGTVPDDPVGRNPGPTGSTKNSREAQDWKTSSSEMKTGPRAQRPTYGAFTSLYKRSCYTSLEHRGLGTVGSGVPVRRHEVGWRNKRGTRVHTSESVRVNLYVHRSTPPVSTH